MEGSRSLLLSTLGKFNESFVFIQKPVTSISTDQTDIYFSFAFEISGNYLIFRYSYYTLLDAFSSTGGIVGIVMLLFKFLAWPIQ